MAIALSTVDWRFWTWRNSFWFVYGGQDQQHLTEQHSKELCSGNGKDNRNLHMGSSLLKLQQKDFHEQKEREQFLMHIVINYTL